ncbi:MAG: tRNA-intron lyase [Desulfurococcales archaeon]|nr:tRNA-intron lyase [Desulfurococcales archaeon]
MKCKARAVLYGNAIIVGSLEESRCLYKLGFYGQPLGVEKPKGADFSSPLRLTPLEALYLLERGLLEVYDEGGQYPLSFEDLWERFKEHYSDLKTYYRIYKDLRDSGLIVRSGLKYGAVFTVYRLGPGLEHAPFILHVRRYNDDLEPTDIVRAGRLSHSVRKAFILASAEPNGDPVYLIFKWLVP